jgi:cysteine-rich repeat protein
MWHLRCLLGLLALIFLAAPLPARADVYWSSVAAACVPEAGALQADRHSSAINGAVSYRSGVTSLDPIILICPVNVSSGGQPPNLIGLTATDTSGSSTTANVRASLIRISRLNGARAEIASVSSDNAPAGTVYGVSAPFTGGLDHGNYLYHVRIVLSRSSLSETLAGIGVVLESTCGNGIRTSNEQCDDGGSQNGDGCSSICRVDANWTCLGTPSVCTPNLISIAVSPTSAIIPAGLTQQFTATGTFADNSQGNVTGAVVWGSTSPSVASVTSGGLATGLAVGSASITATKGAAFGSMTLQVTTPVQVGISISPTIPSVTVGQNQIFSATAIMSDGSTFDATTAVTWSSSNTGVATISNALPTNGVASTLAGGSTTIEAAAGAQSDSTTLTVQPDICGDTTVGITEVCDDGNQVGGDGCSASCSPEVGFSCAGSPSVCTPQCGDEQIVGGETCDDGDTTGGDGCSASCTVEAGFACTGVPSVCGPFCSVTTCDDFNVCTVNGCSAALGSCTFQNEPPGTLCPGGTCSNGACVQN